MYRYTTKKNKKKILIHRVVEKCIECDRMIFFSSYTAHNHVCVCMYVWICVWNDMGKKRKYLLYLLICTIFNNISKSSRLWMHEHDCHNLLLLITFDIQVDFVPSNTHQRIYKYVYVRCTRMGWVFEYILSNGSYLILRLKFLCVRSRLMDGKFSGYFCLYQRFTVWKRDFRMF